MGNVSGEQKGNMKETMHTDTRLTNDDEIIYTFNDAMTRDARRLGEHKLLQ